jgi:hypothetical protein
MTGRRTAAARGATMKKIATLLLTLPALAHAHPGHGIDAPLHWHASDTWGWIALAVIAAVALAWGRRE